MAVMALAMLAFAEPIADLYLAAADPEEVLGSPRQSRGRAFVLRIEPCSKSRPLRASIPFVMPSRQRCASC